MGDLHSIHPVTLAMTLFSKRIVGIEYYSSIQESMKSPEKDKVVILSEILMKMYDTLNKNDTLSTSVCDVLRCVSPDCAEKFQTEMSKLHSQKVFIELLLL